MISLPQDHQTGFDLKKKSVVEMSLGQGLWDRGLLSRKSPCGLGSLGSMAWHHMFILGPEGFGSVPAGHTSAVQAPPHTSESLWGGLRGTRARGYSLSVLSAHQEQVELGWSRLLRAVALQGVALPPMRVREEDLG